MKIAIAVSWWIPFKEQIKFTGQVDSHDYGTMSEASVDYPILPSGVKQ